MPCLSRQLGALLVTLLIIAVEGHVRPNPRPPRYPPISKAPNPPPIVGLAPFTGYPRDIPIQSPLKPLPYYSTMAPLHAPLDIPPNRPPWALKPLATRFEPLVPPRTANRQLGRGFLYSGPTRYLPGGRPASRLKAGGLYPQYQSTPLELGSRGGHQSIGFATPHPIGVIPPPPVEWYPRRQQPLHGPTEMAINTKLPKPPKPLNPFSFSPRHPQQPHINPPPDRNAIVDNLWRPKSQYESIAVRPTPATPESNIYHQQNLAGGGTFHEQRGFIQPNAGPGPDPYISRGRPHQEPRGQIPYEQMPAHITQEYSVLGGMPYNPPLEIPPPIYNGAASHYNYRSREPAPTIYVPSRPRPGELYPDYREVIPTGTVPTPTTPPPKPRVRQLPAVPHGMPPQPQPPGMPPQPQPSGKPRRPLPSMGPGRPLPRRVPFEGETLCGPSIVTTPPPVATFAPYLGPLAVGERRMGEYGGSFYVGQAVGGQSMAKAKAIAAGRGRLPSRGPPPTPPPVCYCDTASDCNPGPPQELGRNYTLDHCYDLYGLDPSRIICCCHG